MRQIRFVTAHRGDEESFLNSPIYRSLGNRYDLAARLDNRAGLPKVYNDYLNGKIDHFNRYGPWTLSGAPAPTNNDIVVFLHDDVEMLGNNVERELNRWADEGFALMGLAGAARINMLSPALWHRIAHPGTLSGLSIFHTSTVGLEGATTDNDPDQPQPSLFGPLQRVIVLDGLFIAVSLKLAMPTGWRFDEDFDFHHYDLASCLGAHMLGLKMRTVFVPVVHCSRGLQSPEDPVFKRNEEKFLQKFSAPKT